jgi:diguanylate cyclase (GGDEF)-like protein
MGKTGGLIYGLLYVFVNLTFFLRTMQGESPVPYAVFVALAVIFSYVSIKWIEDIEMKEGQYELWEGEIEKERIEFTEKINKIRGVIEANKGRIKNYLKLNEIAQKLTSALDRKVIVKIINDGMNSILGNKQAEFMLLIRSEDNDMFYPALENHENETFIRGTIKVYRKDPFDDWVIKNKYTLIIKNIDEDFRFKLVRRDWIKFKSMIAIPLIVNTKIIGLLKFYSDVPKMFDAEDARLLNYLGDLCTNAVQNAILYTKTRELATKDGLTGLFIRRHFMEKLDEEFKRARQLNETFSYLMIDIDHFKECNDTHGHTFGDKVLKMLGEFLKDNLRDVDIIGRYGGEEFAIVLPNTNLNGARFVAERLRANFEKLIINVNENEKTRLTLSGGGMEFNSSCKLGQMVNNADKALYHSKESGRNRITFWEDISDEK